MAQTALIIIPEEAELLIPLLRVVETPVTHLLIYAAPVTRKMLHFNGLEYYAVPSLPKGWKAPRWLTIELGIFAGRLYFEFEEYDDLCRFLGLQEVAAKPAETTDHDIASDELHGAAEGTTDDATNEAGLATKAHRPQSFTKKPLTFLQEWLAVRRKGQDFVHTPMGHVCQGKPLTANHPFFARVETDNAQKSNDTDMTDGQGKTGHARTRVDEEVYDDNDSYDDGGMFDEGDLRGEGETAVDEAFPDSEGYESEAGKTSG